VQQCAVGRFVLVLGVVLLLHLAALQLMAATMSLTLSACEGEVVDSQNKSYT
jgi:hypothetical protein